MFKYTLNYKNFRDEDKTKVLRFNLSETEMRDLIKNDPSFNPGYLASLRTENVEELQPFDIMKMYDIIRKLVVYSYGEISEDGDQFRKNEEMVDAFVQSAAYEAFMDKILGLETGDSTVLTAFLTEVLPAKLRPAMKERLAAVDSKG